MSPRHFEPTGGTGVTGWLPALAAASSSLETDGGFDAAASFESADGGLRAVKIVNVNRAAGMTIDMSAVHQETRALVALLVAAPDVIFEAILNLVS